MPPGRFGGNMDTRQLVQGTTLYLPVEVEGALFSCGDAHAAQGDGEVCVTGIEAPMHGELRFTLEKGLRIPAPQYQTACPLFSPESPSSAVFLRHRVSSLKKWGAIRTSNAMSCFGPRMQREHRTAGPLDAS